jgi:imidazolonepropionase-like amidohydrolase
MEDGMTQAEVLQAVSLHGAMALGIDDRLGSIEPEKEATFTMIEDRLDDPNWYRSVRMVMQKGKVTQTQ